MTGFEGDGFACVGTATYGDTCTEDVQCASDICAGAPYNHCSAGCDQAIANHCRDVGAAGFCVETATPGFFLCVGDLDTGLDTDDAILTSGDSVTRSLGSLTDADLFHLNLLAGSYLIEASSSDGVDLQLEAYNTIGEPIGIFDQGGPNETESGLLVSEEPEVTFVVIRNVGISTGNYTFSVTPVPSGLSRACLGTRAAFRPSL